MTLRGRGLVAFIEALENSDADFAYQISKPLGFGLAPKGYGQFAKVDKLGYFKHFQNTAECYSVNGVWKTEHLQSVSNHGGCTQILVTIATLSVG